MSRILITDDNSEYRQSVIEILRLEGYEVVEAAEGRQALDLIRTQSPDLILCDIDMPVMNGFDTLQQVKADPTLATIPFILVTARADAASIARGKQLGAADYIVKPMNIDLLFSKINDYLVPRT